MRTFSDGRNFSNSFSQLKSKVGGATTRWGLSGFLDAIFPSRIAPKREIVWSVFPRPTSSASRAPNRFS
jgi:hypothetical protein